MNRRELFAGAGAAALSAVVPELPAEAFTGVTVRPGGFPVDDSTSIWVVSWGDGRPLETLVPIHGGFERVADR